jgi:hypothetical protein
MLGDGMGKAKLVTERLYIAPVLFKLELLLRGHKQLQVFTALL